MMEPQDTPGSVNVTATCEEASTRGAHGCSPDVLMLITELQDWPATGRGDGLDAGVVAGLMRRAAKAIQSLAAPQWQPISTAPRDGTELNGYRPDQGVFTFRWAEMSEFVDEDAIIDEKTAEFAWWWHDRWGWMEQELTPTHWQPLPEWRDIPAPPLAADGSRKE